MLRKLIMTDDEMDGVDSNLIRGCVVTNIPQVSQKKLITRLIRNDNKPAVFSHWEDGDHKNIEGLSKIDLLKISLLPLSKDSSLRIIVKLASEEARFLEIARREL